MSWTLDLQRLVLALAVRGDMLTRARDAVRPESFKAGDVITPIERIASAISTFYDKYGTRPDPTALGQIVADERLKLGPAESEALAAELENVLELDLPGDASWVYDRAREVSAQKRLEDGILKAAGMLRDGGPAAVLAAREVLAKASTEEADQVEVLEYFGAFEDRVREWRTGMVYGERIPTGLEPLDRAIGGGGTRKETWYFLAPPKGAKTTFLMRVALGAARRGFGVYVTTFEMQAMRMALRLDRGISRQSKAELLEDTRQLERVMAGWRRNVGTEIYIEERPPQQANSVDAMERQIERIRKRGGKVDVVIPDYLNIMGAGKNEREKRHELARVSRDIGKMARSADVLVWTAALVNRQAVDKRVIRKTDIAEAFEVIAVLDGAVAICAPPDMVRNGTRRLWVAAAREEQDEVKAGDYRVDLARQAVDEIPDTGDGDEADTDEQEA